MKRFHFLSLLICLFTAMTVSAMQNEQEIAGKVMEAVRRGDQNTALQILNQALSADPNKLNLVMMRANVHEEMGNYQQAKSDLQRLIDAAPQIPDAWIARARVYIREGNGKAGLNDVNQTLSLQNNHPEAMFLRIAAHYLVGDHDSTETYATGLIGPGQHAPPAYLMRAMARLMKGKTREAVQDVEYAMAVDPAYPLNYLVRAYVLERTGDKLGAENDRQLACALLPTLCDADPTDNKTFGAAFFQTGPASGDWASASSTLYNDRFVHMEDRVRQTLAGYQRIERANEPRYKIYKDFSFRDSYVESGLAFRHKVTIDSAKNWKPVHYDHGSGVAIADVNNDNLMDIYFVNQLGESQLYLYTYEGAFKLAENAGVGLGDRIGVAAAFADIDNDGDADLYATSVRGGNVLFENDGTGKFKDITAKAGLTYSGHSSGATFLDFDNDGLLDLFLTNVGNYTHDEKGPGGFYLGRTDAFSGHLFPERTERSILYRNLGGNRFKDVSEDVGLIDDGWSGDVVFTDLNGDRYPDLYVLNMQGDDRYWENDGGKRFRENGAAIFPKTPWGSMGAKFFDANNDGAPELYLTDMHSDMSQKVNPEFERRKSTIMWSDSFLQGGENNIFGNAFYENDGKGAFEEKSDAMNLENYWPWGLSTGDLNADGYQDIFVAASMNHPFRYATNAVYLNNHGDEFLDSAFALKVEPRPLSVKPWFTLDCGGADKDSPYCIGRDRLTAMWGAYGTRASVIFDWDRDGDLDIVTNEFNGVPLVLTSDLNNRKKVNRLAIRLVGTTSNRDGLGAKVQVKTGDMIQTQWMDGKLGYLAQSRAPLYFGLGEANEVDEIRVEWPSGIVQVITDNIVLQLPMDITEPKKGSEP